MNQPQKQGTNFIELQSDGVVVQFEGEVKPSNLARFIFWSLILVILIGFGVLISTTGDGNPGDPLGFAAVVLAGMVLVFAGKSLLWNIAGTESISISGKSIVFHRRYGMFAAGEKIIVHDGRLRISFYESTSDVDLPEGIFILHGYDVHDQPVEIFRNAIPMTKDQFVEFRDYLETIPGITITDTDSSEDFFQKQL